MNGTPDTYWDLFFGYSAIWACIVIYLFRLQLRQRRLADLISEIDESSASK